MVFRDVSRASDHSARVVWVSFDVIGRDCLMAVAESGARVVGIVTLPGPLSPDRAGQCPFHEVARDLNATLIETRDVNERTCVNAVRSLSPDMLFVVGWSQLVRRELIDAAPRGVFGMHPTLLPKHRGRAPIPWAILSGLARTGVTLFEIVDERADSGLLVGQLDVSIEANETATSLFEKVHRAHVDLVRKLLPSLLDGSAPRIRQDESRASSWPKRGPVDGIIDWDARVLYLHDWVRAQTRPYPGAFTYLDDRKLVVWRAAVLEENTRSQAGKVLAVSSDGAVVGCGEGELLLEEIEVGGRVLTGPEICDLLREGTTLG
jgi:methionyl-tRNA formyltransferase